MQNRCTQRRERGSVLIAFLLMIGTIIAFTGLAVDVGYAQFEKRKLQVAADAAAMGALREMERGNTDYTAAAQNDASLNGFTNGQNSTTVTVANPPTGGTYANDTSAIEVSVQRTLPTFFMRIFGQNLVNIGATATARTSSTEGSIGGCIFAMDPTASGSLNISGNMTISTACSAVVKSTSSTAFMMGGNSTWNLTNGAAIGVVGPGTAGIGWDLYGSYLINSTTAAYETPVNISTFNDPLAGVAAPTPSGLTIQSSGAWSDNNPHSDSTLSPGIYCGGLTIHGTVNFNPGIYVVAGGGIGIGSQANLSVVTPASGETGVMFYNTSSNSDSWGCSGGAVSAGDIAVTGTPSINLAGLSTTSPVGVLFFDDRNISGLSHTIRGNSTSTFDGAMYFLNNTLTFNGNNKTPGFLYIVADMININGNANLGNDHSSLANAYTLAPTSTGGGLVQ